MTAIQNYAQIIDRIFGQDTAAFDQSNDICNPVIGALTSSTYFFDFKANFVSRLERLRKIYDNNPNLNEIKVQVNEVASAKNWEGAFAELAAYDHFNHDLLRQRIFLQTPINLNVTLNRSETFALELGKSAANLDGYVEDCGLYFDVKCFKDNVSDILSGIFDNVKQHLGRDDFDILPEHALDISYDDFQARRNDLLKELKGQIVPDETRFIASNVIPGLRYRILWGAGINTAERSYHPYIHAENFHRIVFNYANKFHKSRPSVIVLVVFPWYNLVVSDFSNSNIKMYRALARRAFCQYRHNNFPFRNYDSKFQGSETIYQVSNNLSGIIFLEDNTILSKEPNNTNVKSFTYLNPNASNSITRSLARHFISGLHNSDFDDFVHDNY